MSTGKFTAEKVLNKKHQENGKRIVLIQWKEWGIEEATWEPEEKFSNIEELIEEYEEKRINDRVRNFALKETENLDCGENPYKETERYGHFMYGDEPECIESIKIFENLEDSDEKVTVVCEIKWKLRKEMDEFGHIDWVILENSFMDSKTIKEFKPDFLIKNYEKLVSLNLVSEAI